MGSGLAKNLLKAGFKTAGYDVSQQRVTEFENAGGHCCRSVSEVGQCSDAVFVMVMNGTQAKQVICGDSGSGEGALIDTMTKGSAIILSATVKPAEARDIAQSLSGTGIHLIDAPVSGGYAGAQNGTLTIMAAAPDSVLESFDAVLRAVSSTIHTVGDVPGDGQVMKACLQSIIGSVFSATFEATTLAAKAGVRGQALYDVVSTSGAGCAVANTALKHIIDRQFDRTGSHINTMHKDLTISLDLATELGVPMHLATSAMQLFHAGKSRYPDGDNWAVTRVLEDITGAELHR